MTAIIILGIFIAAMATAPWLGADSRRLDPRRHTSDYPAAPPVSTR